MVLGVRLLAVWLAVWVLGASPGALAATTSMPNYVRTGEARYGHLSPAQSRPRAVRTVLD